MVRILHFSDAHIDMVRQGRRDPESGLPLRTLDYLKALDSIMDTAIAQKVEMVLFTGDAYRDRTPAPTFQREWGKRVLRLSQAGIFTIMVVGNHDVSPASGRAHALQEYETLRIPNTYVVSKPCFLKPEDLNGIPLQVIGLPWLSRSGMMAYFEAQQKSADALNLEMEEMLSDLLTTWYGELDPTLPTILTSHVTVQGAFYGNERSVMLGRDMVISPALLKNKKVDYVALGHIHRFQDLNEGQYPPIVYAGSIERMDFGEMHDKKGFVIAEVEKGSTTYTFHPLKVRKYLSVEIELETEKNINEFILKKLPPKEEIRDAIVRIVLVYPRQWEALIDERAIRDHMEGAFEFYLLRHPRAQSRVLLPDNLSLAQLPPLDLLELYWKSIHMESDQAKELTRIAAEILHAVEMEEPIESVLDRLEQKEGEA